MAKTLTCVMPDCNTVIVGKDADEVFAKAEAHARKEHNMTIIPPSVMSQIEAAIKDK
jgi:predicted small metal-binding protein